MNFPNEWRKPGKGSTDQPSNIDIFTLTAIVMLICLVFAGLSVHKAFSAPVAGPVSSASVGVVR